MQYKVSGSWPLNHNTILSIASTAGFPPSLHSGSPWTKSREVRERARGGAGVTGTREKRERLGAGSLRTGSPFRACARTLSSSTARGTATRALAASELLPTNFRARLPATSGAQGDSQRPGRRPGPPVPSPFIPCGARGSRSASPGPRRPSAEPREAGLGSGGAGTPSERATGGQDGGRGERLGNPRAPVSPRRVRKRPARRRAVSPAGRRSGSPTSLSPGTFRAPSPKRK